MSRSLPALAALCLMSAPVCAMADNARVEIIRKRSAEVDGQLAKCKQLKRELTGYSAEGGELSAWFLGNALPKLSVLFLGETGKASEDYYFWNDRLFFVYRVESRYTAPLSGKVKSTAEDRFYFDDGKLIRWIDASKKQIDPGSDEAMKRAEEVVRGSKEFAALAKGLKRN